MHDTLQELARIDAPQQERFRVAWTKRFALGNGRELVHFPLTGATAVLPAYVVSLLSGCRDFRTIDEHLRVVGAQLGVGAAVPEAIRSIFTSGEQAGYLTSERTLLGAARGSGSSGPETGVDQTASERARIGHVGIVTASRDGLLERCLQGALDHLRQHGRDAGITVVDDAADASRRRDRRTALNGAARGARVPIAYAGAEEKGQFVDALVSVGIDPSPAAFALLDDAGCGFSAGANRNALLLHHAGEAVFQVDDDVVWRVAAPRAARDELCFTPGHNPNRIDFFADQAGAIAHASFVERDLLASHEMLLGRGIAACAAASGGLASGGQTQLSDNLLRLAVRGTGRVAVTQNGLVGDCGFQSPWPFLLIRGPLRDELHTSERTFRLASGSRAIAQTVLAPTISEGAFCMSYALGLDHRQLLPPFFPVQRNGDGIFGTLLRACREEALFGHVPVQLVHDPPEARAYAADSLWRPPRVEMHTIVLQAIRAIDCGPVTDGRRRMRAFGRHLCDLASVTPAAFLACVRERAWINMRNQVQTFQALLKDYGRQPEYWAAECDRHVEDLIASAIEPTFGVPVDLLPGRGPEAALALAQHLMHRFGELLEVWPEMVEAASLLRSRGMTLARCV